jgi:hypothetical protein
VCAARFAHCAATAYAVKECFAKEEKEKEEVPFLSSLLLLSVDFFPFKLFVCRLYLSTTAC